MISDSENIDLISKIIKNEDIIQFQLKKNDVMGDLTIVIPTHNRHDHLNRSIQYYKLSGIHCVYIDSSDNFFEILEKPDNIEYIHLPKCPFVKKMVYTLSKIQSPIICTCADDDFYFLEELAKGYHFLQKNPDYVLYLGQILSFNLTVKKFQKAIQKEKVGRNIFGSERKRAYRFFKRYMNVLWGISRRNSLLKGYQMLDMTDFNNHNFYELTLGTNFSFLGNIFVSNGYLLLREASETSWGRHHESLIFSRFSNNFYKDYQKFLKITDETLYKNYGKFAFNVYFFYGYKNKIFYRIITLMKRIKRLIIRIYNRFKNTSDLKSQI